MLNYGSKAGCRQSSALKVQLCSITGLRMTSTMREISIRALCNGALNNVSGDSFTHGQEQSQFSGAHPSAARQCVVAV